MGKLILTVIGIILLTVFSSAQDLGRLRQIMMMRQREMALRRGFPFGVGVGPMRGPGIPPPLAARLALLQRQRALNPFLPTTPFGSPFDTSIFGSTALGPSGPFSGGPFSSPFSLAGPTDFTGLGFSSVGFPGGPGETFTMVETGGISPGGPSGIPSIGGPFIGGSSGTSSMGGDNSFTSTGGQTGTPSMGGTGSFSPSGGQSGIPSMGGANTFSPSGGQTGFPSMSGSNTFSPIGGQTGIPSMGGPNTFSPMGGQTGVPTSGGFSGSMSSISGQRGGNGNIFGQQPTQAAEFLETNRGTVEPGPQMGNNGRRQRPPSRNGFRPTNPRQINRRQNGPMRRFRGRPDNPRDRPPMMRPRPPPAGLPPLPPLPLVAPNDAMQVRAPIPVPAQPAFVPINPQLMFPMSPPPGPRMPPRRRRRRGPRRRRNQRPTSPRVFPNVPEIPQIPAAPNTQGQSNDGQQQGNVGFGQDGAGQGNNQFGFNNQQGMPSNGDPRMGPNPFFPGQIAGGSRFSTTMGQGGAIFPSQAAQGPIMRQPGPGFSDASSTMFPGGPNGRRPQPGRGGAFDQSNQFPFPGGEGRPGGFPGGEGRPGGFPGGMMFPGFAGPTFPGGRPFGPAPGGPGQAFNGQPQFGGRGQAGQMGGSRFGFVDPSTGGAGPAFSTNNQSPQDFNLQFRPLPSNPNVRPMPEMRPDQNQMGLGSMDAGFSSGGMGQPDMQFGGSMGNINMGNMGNMGSQGGASQGNTFSGSSTTNVVTTNMGSNQQTGEGKNFDTGNQASSLTVSDRTINENSASGSNNGEFRLVEVGNVVDKSGLVKPAVMDGASNNMNTVTITETKTTNFGPTGDISTAFESFGDVTAFDNMIDLSATDGTSSASNATVITSSGDVMAVSGGAGSAASGSAASAASGSVAEATSGSSGSSDSSVSTMTSSSNVMPESPFANSMNKDFSFFMVENPQSQPPNEMPAINVPVPTTNPAATDDASSKQTNGFMNPFGSGDGFSKPLEPLVINDITKEKGHGPSDPTDGFQAIFTEFLASPGGDGFTPISSGPIGTQTMSFPVTGTTANEATSSGSDQGFSFMTSSSSSSSSSTGALDNTIGDISMSNSMGDLTMVGGNSMGDITLGETPIVAGDIAAPVANTEGGFV